MDPYKDHFTPKGKIIFKNQIENRRRNWIITSSSVRVFYFLLDLWILTIQKCSAQSALDKNIGSMNLTHSMVVYKFLYSVIEI